MSRRTPSAISVALLLALGACGGPEVGAVTVKLPEAPRSFPERGPLQSFFSKRFHLRVPFVDGKAWRIDDHSERQLVARHPDTESVLTILLTTESEATSPARCRARAARYGFLAQPKAQLISEETGRVAEHFDAELRLSLGPAPQSNEKTTARLFVVASYLRQCLFADFVTTAPGGAREVLSERAAVVRARMLPAMRAMPIEALPREPLPKRMP